MNEILVPLIALAYSAIITGVCFTMLLLQRRDHIRMIADLEDIHAREWKRLQTEITLHRRTSADLFQGITQTAKSQQEWMSQPSRAIRRAFGDGVSDNGAPMSAMPQGHEEGE